MRNIFIILMLIIVSNSMFSLELYGILNEDFLQVENLDYRAQYKIGHFLNPLDYSLVGFDLSNICVFEIEENKLIHTQSQNISNLELKHRNVRDFVTGDFNDNGIDEIIVFNDKTIYCFEWDGSIFQLTEYESPYYIHQLVIGDITNNGRTNIVMSCMDDSLANIYQHGQFNTLLKSVLISHESENISFEEISNSKLRINSAIPSDRLVAVFDIDNDDINELIVSDAQSDVSPTYFRVFSWNENSKSLDLLNSIEFSNFQLNPKPLEYDKLSNYISGKIYPLNLNETTYFLANIWGTKKTFTASVRLLSIENNNLISHGEIAEKKGWADTTFIFQSKDDKIYFLQIDFNNIVLKYAFGYLNL